MQYTLITEHKKTTRFFLCDHPPDISRNITTSVKTISSVNKLLETVCTAAHYTVTNCVAFSVTSALMLPEIYSN